MKALVLCLSAAAIAVNVVGNWRASSADGIEAARIARIEKLCNVNPNYCR